MKRIHWLIVAVIALVIIACRIEGVHAAPMQYYGTPFFYGKYSVEKQDCIFVKDARYGVCGDIRDPEEAVVGWTSPTDDSKGIGVRVTSNIEVTCVNGRCFSNYGEPLGEIDTSITSYWFIPLGYYITASGKGVVAYQQGTGPLAEKYLRYPVKVLPELQDPPRGIARRFNDGLDRYEIYCNKALECSFMGKQMIASELSKYVPKVLTYSCDSLFCYHADKTIAGLNPKG